MSYFYVLNSCYGLVTIQAWRTVINIFKTVQLTKIKTQTLHEMLVKVRTWLANPFHIVNKKGIGSKKWTLNFVAWSQLPMSQHYLTAIKRGKKLHHCEICIHEHLYVPYIRLRYFAWFRNCTSEVSTGPFTASKDFYRIFRISVISSSYKSLFPLDLYSRACFCIRTSCILSNSSCNLTVLF
jgi:hypothetical protein